MMTMMLLLLMMMTILTLLLMQMLFHWIGYIVRTVHVVKYVLSQNNDDDDDNDDDDGVEVDSTTFMQLQNSVYQDADGDASDSDSWVDWIRRCAHEVEARMQRMKLDDWITMQRRRKWRCAGKIAQTSFNEWIAMAIRWDPTLDLQLNARRRPGRPKTRWTDDIWQCPKKTLSPGVHNYGGKKNLHFRW